MGLDLKHVESFLAVAETLSFSKAAERTNTVQSAISTHIGLLEAHVNRALVARGRGRAVALTDDGAAFLVDARRLLMMADQMARPPGGAVQAKPLRFGTTVTFAVSIVPSVLAAFARQASACPVSVRTARSHSLMTLLEEGAIDVALVFDQGAHPMRRSTTETALSWVGAETFKPLEDQPLPLAFLDDARDLRRHAYKALDQAPARPTVLTTHADAIGLRAVVAAGLAVTILPRIALVAPFADAAETIKAPPLPSMSLSVYGRTGPHSGELDSFCDLLTNDLRAFSA
ncbi:MAG: LysR family transcriptional regulator [Pseudomonadota bacterium]